jgi:hypothetical protein
MAMGVKIEKRKEVLPVGKPRLAWDGSADRQNHRQMPD